MDYYELADMADLERQWHLDYLLSLESDLLAWLES